MSLFQVWFTSRARGITIIHKVWNRVGDFRLSGAKAPGNIRRKCHRLPANCHLCMSTTSRYRMDMSSTGRLTYGVYFQKVCQPPSSAISPNRSHLGLRGVQYRIDNDMFRFAPRRTRHPEQVVSWGLLAVGIGLALRTPAWTGFTASQPPSPTAASAPCGRCARRSCASPEVPRGTGEKPAVASMDLGSPTDMWRLSVLNEV